MILNKLREGGGAARLLHPHDCIEEEIFLSQNDKKCKNYRKSDQIIAQSGYRCADCCQFFKKKFA
jgi:hypothetical protein